MALWSTVQINGNRIGAIDVQRIAPDLLPSEIAVGTICRYRWKVTQLKPMPLGAHGSGMAEPLAVVEGELEHPYATWVTLYAAVLAAASEQIELSAGTRKT